MENQVEDVSATPTFVRYAQAGLPLILPWHPTMTVAPGTLFHSRLYQTENPWAKDSPFVPESLGTTPVTFRVVDGGAASYKSVEGSSSSSNEEHLSVGLGVSADCMFLTASVSGQYDKNVQENKSSNKSSVRSTFRYGTVMLSAIPKLTDQAIITIKYEGGLSAFEERYGDYYVAGYRLGGDTGVLFASSKSTSVKDEDVSVTVKVESFIADAEYRTNKHWRELSYSAQMDVIGYDTLTHQSVLKSSGEGKASPSEIVGEVCSLLRMGRDLPWRVEREIKKYGLENSVPLSAGVCDQLTKGCLVVELILLPVRTWREVLVWSNNTDVI